MANSLRTWIASALLYAGGIIYQICHTRFHRILNVLQPAYTPPPKSGDSAILMIGVDSGQGNIALKLSSLGYTVILVFDPKFASEDSIEIPSLLHSWHVLRRDDTSKVWGAVMPMTANIQDALDRRRVRETVEAYCSQQSLNLSIVMYLPTVSLAKESDLLPQHRSFKMEPIRYLDIDRLRKYVHDDVIGVYVSLNDYIPMLSKASGRVILLSEENCFGLSARHREAASRTLDDELRPLGINVISILSGPRRVRPSISQPAIASTPKHQSSLFSLLNFWSHIGHSRAWLIDSFYVSEEEYIENIQATIQTTNPVHQQYVGSYPFAKDLMSRCPWLVDRLM